MLFQSGGKSADRFQSKLVFLHLPTENYVAGLTWAHTQTWAASWQNQQNGMCSPAKTQISLGIRPVWSESSLFAWRKLGSLATHWVHSEDSDHTGWMPMLIWVFAGRTVILLVFVRRRLVCYVVRDVQLMNAVTVWQYRRRLWRSNAFAVWQYSGVAAKQCMYPKQSDRCESLLVLQLIGPHKKCSGRKSIY